MNNAASAPIILDASRMSEHMARYWNSLARRMAGKVSVVDPWRTPLRSLRVAHPELKGRSIYRASTGGRYGKSAQVTTL